MRTRSPRALAGALLVLAAAQPAFANQPPAGQVMLAELALPLLIAALTALGGGYAVLAARGDAGGWGRPALGVFAVVVFSAMHEVNGLFGALAFAGIGVARGVRLIAWGLAAARNAGDPGLAGASPRRLALSGALLVALAVPLGGAGVAFLGYWPNERGVREQVPGLVAYVLHKGRTRAATDGRPRYEALPREEGRLSEVPFLYEVQHGPERGARFGVTYEPSADGASFQLWVTPECFPLWPYSYLVSLPSFHADATGAVRAVRVRGDGERCPGDAPVVEQVTEADVQALAERLAQYGGTPAPVVSAP